MTRPARSRRSAKDAQRFLMGDEGRPIRDRPFVRLFLFREEPAFISADSLFARLARHTIIMCEALSLASGCCAPFPDPASQKIRSAVPRGTPIADNAIPRVVSRRLHSHC